MEAIRITVNLSQDESKALLAIAKAELRHPREQAHFFIFDGLVRRGLLPQPAVNQVQPDQVQQVKNGRESTLP